MLVDAELNQITTMQAVQHYNLIEQITLSVKLLKCIGSVVECLIGHLEVDSWSLTGGTALCT